MRRVISSRVPRPRMSACRQTRRFGCSTLGARFLMPAGRQTHRFWLFNVGRFSRRLSIRSPTSARGSLPPTDWALVFPRLTDGHTVVSETSIGLPTGSQVCSASACRSAGGALDPRVHSMFYFGRANTRGVLRVLQRTPPMTLIWKPIDPQSVGDGSFYGQVSPISEAINIRVSTAWAWSIFLFDLLLEGPVSA